MSVVHLATTPKPAPLGQETLRFWHDIHSWFRGSSSGHLVQYLHSDPMHESDPVRGTKLWGHFVARYADYYIYPNEMALIEQYSKDIAHIVGSHASLIELGPGSELAVSQKTIPLFKALRPISYIPVDCAESYLQGAAETIRRIQPDLTIEPECCNFYESYFSFEHISKPVACMWSSTISNADLEGNDMSLPRVKIVDMLRRLREFLGPRSWLTLTVDSNQDAASVIRSYKSDDFSIFILNMMLRIQRDLPTSGFNPHYFAYEPEWYAEHHLLAHMIRVTCDHSFLIGAQTYSLRRGQRLCIATSFKYPTPMFQDIARDAGFESRAVFPDRQNRVSLHLLKAI